MPMINGKSRQVAIRFKLDTHELLEKDSKRLKQKQRGVSTVVNRIVEKHYEPRLKKIRSGKK